MGGGRTLASARLLELGDDLDPFGDSEPRHAALCVLLELRRELGVSSMPLGSVAENNESVRTFSPLRKLAISFGSIRESEGKRHLLVRTSNDGDLVNVGVSSELSLDEERADVLSSTDN